MPSQPAAIVPAAPFRQPVNPPVLGTGNIIVQFDQAWLPYLVGAAKVLVASSTWDPLTEKEASDIIASAYDLLSVLSGAVPTDQFLIGHGLVGTNGDEIMLRQNPDNPCELQSSVDGVTWCTWADLSLCQNNFVVPPGTNPDPGKCTSFTFSIYNGRPAILPVALSTGDTIVLDSVSGASSDPGLGADWRCPSGQTYFLGQCVGPVNVNSANINPTAPTGCVLAAVRGNFLELGSSPVAIPGGLTNQQVLLDLNWPTVGAQWGLVTGHVTICKASATPPSSWEAVIDLTTGVGPFTTQTFSGQPSAQWSGGTGFEQNEFNNGDFITGIYVKGTIDAFTMLRMRAAYEVTLGDNSHVGSSDNLSGLIIDTTYEAVRTVATSSNGTWTADFNPGTPQGGITLLEMFNYASDGASVGYQGGTSIISQVIIDGTGPIPSQLAPYVH